MVRKPNLCDRQTERLSKLVPPGDFNAYVDAIEARRFAKNWEWFQWLAEQSGRPSKAQTSLNPGAHEAYRDWRP